MRITIAKSNATRPYVLNLVVQICDVINCRFGFVARAFTMNYMRVINCVYLSAFTLESINFHYNSAEDQ